jgi:uncharacterized protein (TIGR00645 family)
MLRKLEHFLEVILFESRWALVPLYIGLVVTLILLTLKFMQELWHIFPNLFSHHGTELILNILSLVDIVLVANLILIIVFSGYENFVSKIDFVRDHVDRPEWMGKVGYSDLKLKVIGSVVAISSIELLRAFMQIDHMDPETESMLMWKIAIHMTFVISGVLFALMEKLSHKTYDTPTCDKHDAT